MSNSNEVRCPLCHSTNIGSHKDIEGCEDCGMTWSINTNANNGGSMSNCKECGCVVVNSDYCALCAVGVNSNRGGVMHMTKTQIEQWFKDHAAELEEKKPEGDLVDDGIQTDREGNAVLVLVPYEDVMDNNALLSSYDDAIEYSSGRAISKKVRESDDDAVLPMMSAMPTIKVCDVCSEEFEDVEGRECPMCGNYALEHSTDSFSIVFAAHQETIATGTMPDCGRSSHFEEGLCPGQVYVPEHGFATEQEVQSLVHIESKWAMQDIDSVKVNIEKRNAMKNMAKRVIDGYSAKIVECSSKNEANKFIDKAISVFQYILGKNGLNYLFPAVRVLHPSSKLNSKYLESMEVVASVNAEIQYYVSAIESGVINEDIGNKALNKLYANRKVLSAPLGLKLNAELYKRMRVVLFKAWMSTQTNSYEVAFNKVLGLGEAIKDANLSKDEVKMALAHARYLLRKSGKAALPYSIYSLLRSMEVQVA